MIPYRIDIADLHTHHFEVTLQVPRPAAQQELSLPVWIPGSYMVREFGRHLSVLRAWQGRTEVPLQQLDKTTWRADCADTRTLRVSYRVYAFDTSVRTAFLDDRRGFFNGTSLCLRGHGPRGGSPRHQLGAAAAGLVGGYRDAVDWRARVHRGGLRRIGGPPVRARHLLARRVRGLRRAARVHRGWGVAGLGRPAAAGRHPARLRAADPVLAWRCRSDAAVRSLRVHAQCLSTKATVASNTGPARR